LADRAGSRRGHFTGASGEGQGTNKGTVYLTGNVENTSIKTRATELAWQVSGVRAVVNNLKIQ
jgi:hypothetical protein